MLKIEVFESYRNSLLVKSEFENDLHVGSLLLYIKLEYNFLYFQNS